MTDFMDKLGKAWRKPVALLAGLWLAGPGGLFAQEGADLDDEIFELTPFEVVADEDEGYRASSSLAGSRLNTKLEDIGSSISVFTEELMEDVAAVDNETLLAFGTNTEVGGARGNFVNPNSDGLELANLAQPNNNTRVRGLTSADNTRNYFRTDVPWDGYAINRVDLQRGANSILFGLGSPAGIINATTVEASFKDGGEVQIRNDQFGSLRGVFDVNKVLMEDQLAVRLIALRDSQNFRQNPAYEDDNRVFGAITFRPEMLNKEGTTTKLRLNVERGKIDSNRPRYVAPIDQLTPFYLGPNETGFGGPWASYDYISQTMANGTPLAPSENGVPIDQIDRNETRTVNNSSGTPVSMWVGGASGNNPIFYYDTALSTFPQHFLLTEGNVVNRGGWTNIADDGEDPIIVVNDGSQTNGDIQGEIRGVAFFSIKTKDRLVSDLGLEFPGFWRASSFTDTTHFDFFNNLIDGNMKSEAKEFTVVEFDLQNTFLNNMFGYNISLFKQDYSSEINARLGSVFAPSIGVDVGALDGTSSDGFRVPNPVAGRAYVDFNLGHVGSSITTRDRESKRFQGFFRYDFADKGDGWLSRLAGRHDIVGVAQNYTLDSLGQSFRASGWTPEYMAERGDNTWGGEGPVPTIYDTRLAELDQELDASQVNMRVYLEATGPNNTGLQPFTYVAIPRSASLRGFDATPLPGFDAEAAAQDTYQDSFSGVEDATSLELRNPANYVGWVDSVGTYPYIHAEDSPEAREYLTVSRRLSMEDVDSKAAVWTGRFWDGAFVGMYGWREDDAFEAWPTHDYRDDGPITDLSIDESNSRSQKVQSRNWSAKLNLSYLSGLNDRMPFDVHVLYAEGEVQTPDPSRIDVFGRTLQNATGTTEDASIMLVAKDGKWTLRATDYETTVKNAVSGSTVNREKWRIQQVLQQGAFRAGLIENDQQSYTANWLPLSPQAEALGYETEAEYRREVMAPAWRAFEAELWEQFPLTRNWYLSQFQPGDQSAPNIRFPDNATLVEDQISSGYEFEFTANFTKSWNLAVNASKTEAIRDNIPGDEFGAVVDLIVDAMRNTPAGEIPIWWFGGPGVGTWLDPFLGELIQAEALNGASQPEIREWRANVITNYSFNEGPLSGWGMGTALRYEDSAVYGYQPVENPETGDLDIDLDQAFSDDARETVDLWLSYKRKLNDNMDWKIQLNLYNIFGDNELVPLFRNPDGSFGTMGIREGTSWSLTNTFKF